LPPAIAQGAGSTRLQDSRKSALSLVAFEPRRALTREAMSKDVIEVGVRAVLPLEGSVAVFLGNGAKHFVIYVDEGVGAAISMFMNHQEKARPLTHDLIGHILLAFGARVERVVVNSVEGSTFLARLILSAENQLHSRKLVELDARPSDSIALAIQAEAPIFVARQVWDHVEDVTPMLKKIEADLSSQGAHGMVPPDQGSGGGSFEDDTGEGDFLDQDLFGEGLDDMEDDDDEEDDDLYDDDEDDLDEEGEEDEEDDNPFGTGFDDDEGEEWKKA
jgi:bifunctional DNase/RNase